MEIEEVQAELQALWKLYALHRQIGDGIGMPESTLPLFLDERARTLLKDLLDRRWETAIQTYSELLTTPQPNQPPPPPAARPKRECRYCQQRSFKRQASIVQVPDTGRKLVQPRQVLVREAARSVASSASNSSRIRTSRSALEDSRRFSWTTRAETSPSRSCSSSYTISDALSYSGSSSYAYTDSVGRSRSTSPSSVSCYSIEKPARKAVIWNPIARVGPARRRGRGEGGVFKRLKKKLGLVFHHHDHHHHHGRGTSMWRHVKEMLRQGRRRRRSDDDVEMKGKRQSKVKKPPVASKQKAKSRKKRLHWWQLKRRTEGGRNKKPNNKSRTTTNKR